MIAVVHLTLNVELHAVETAGQVSAFAEAQAAAAVAGFEHRDALKFAAQTAHFGERQSAHALAKIDALLELSLARVDVVVGEERRGAGRTGEAHGRGGGGKGGDGESLFHGLTPQNSKRV